MNTLAALSIPGGILGALVAILIIGILLWAGDALLKSLGVVLPAFIRIILIAIAAIAIVLILFQVISGIL